MLTDREISEIAKAGVHEVLPSAKILRVDVEEDIDSTDEHPSLSMVVVFAKKQTVSISGKDFLSLHEAIQRRLLDAGESRYPFLRYVGEKEVRSAVS
jgi:hypothetical protein